jgi:hypothetical protein
MGTHYRSTSGADSLIVARLQGAATRLGRWEPPVGQERQVAIADLCELGGPDPAPYVQAAGIMLGCHPPGDSSHTLYRNGAALLLEAAGLTEGDEEVQTWIAVGEERRVRTRAAQRAGDHWNRS